MKFATVAFFLLASISTDAATNQWTPLGPDGGPTATVVVDPSNRSTIYAGTARGLVKSVDNGATWRFVYFGLIARVTAIAVDPRNGNNLVASSDGGVIRSSDGGETWLTTPRQGFEVLLWSPGGVVYGASGSVEKSLDGGATWSSVAKGLSGSVRDMAIGPPPRYRLHVLTNDGVVGLTDGGDWSDPFRIGGGTSLDISNDGTTVVGRTNGVARARPTANAWSAANAGLPAALTQTGSDFVVDITADPSAANSFYAVLHEGGTYRSDDGGASWRAINNGTGAIVAHDLVVAEDALFVSSELRGILRSDDGGETWRASNKGYSTQRVEDVAVHPAVPDRIIASTFDNGLFVSRNGGLDWSATDAGLMGPAVVAVAPSDPARVYVATNMIRRSDDGGDTWSAPVAPAGGFTVNKIVVDPTNRDIVYAAAQAFGVSKSVDGGETWTRINTGLTGIEHRPTLSIDPRDPATLYYSAFAPYVTRNGGMTWSRVTLDPFFVVTPGGESSTLYAVGMSRVTRSIDDGATWQPFISGLPPLGNFDRYVSLHRDSIDGALYVVRENASTAPPRRTIYRLAEGADEWQKLPDLPMLTVTLATRGNTLYAGTQLGVFALSVGPPEPRRRAVRR